MSEYKSLEQIAKENGPIPEEGLEVTDREGFYRYTLMAILPEEKLAYRALCKGSNAWDTRQHNIKNWKMVVVSRDRVAFARKTNGQLSVTPYPSEATARADLGEKFREWPARPDAEGFFEVEDHICQAVDAKTILEWHSETFGPMTWEEAMKKAESLGDGWRLPTIEELSSMFDRTSGKPAGGFVSVDYWTSTSNALLTYNAWHVNFRSGFVSNNNKPYKYYVRCVREAPL